MSDRKPKKALKPEDPARGKYQPDKLEESEERYRILFEHAGDGLFLMFNTRFVDCNARTLEMFDLTREQIIGKSPLDLSPEFQPDGIKSDEKAEQMVAAALSGNPQFFEWEHIRSDGTHFFVDVNLTPVSLKGEQHLFAVLRDITANREAKELLEQSEKKYREVIENAGEGIFVAQDGIIKFLNPFALDFIGYSEEELRSRPFLELIHPDDQEIVFDNYTRRLSGEEVSDTATYRIIVKGGEVKWVEAHTVLITWEGEPATLNFVSDITDRIEAEEALRLSEQKFETAFRSSPDAITISSLQTGVIVEINEGFEKLSGYKAKEAIGQTTEDLELWAEPELRDSLVALLQAEGSVKDFEMKYRTKSGAVRDAELAAEVIDLRGEQHLLTVVRDITERKLAEKELREKEEQLLQSQKLEAVGQLAGGIAHDFNNMLGVIIGYSDLALMKLEDTDPQHGDFTRIKDAAERATGMTSQLLAFSRKQKIQARNIDLNRTIENIEKILGRLIGEHINIKMELNADSCLVFTDPTQIDQVIMNLAVNARDAMPDGGSLTIGTSCLNVDTDIAGNLEGIEAGPYVLLSVADTGLGMDKETRVQIFDPFFTTKEVGKGTGLGLATVYGIIKQSNGFIGVQSEPGQGTTFKIYFPIVEGMASTDTESSQDSNLTSDGEIVLLVEDDDYFRDLTHRMLLEYGYKVLVARSAGEALLVCEQQDEPIPLMVTDVVMPQMSGPKLAERVADLQPEMKVLYMSGYTYDIMDQHGLSDADINLIEKPFTPVALARKLREILTPV